MDARERAYAQAIHVLIAATRERKTWMPGIKPGMTKLRVLGIGDAPGSSSV